jgi:ABC-type nitrate/sulfonate/bicarbonate transport system permease component
MGEVDPKLLEMAEVFHIPKKARMKYIILPAKMPGLSRLFGKKSAADTSAPHKGKKGGAHR